MLEQVEGFITSTTVGRYLKRNSQRVVPVGIRTHNRQWKVEGVHYENNIFGALNHIIRLDTEAVLQGRGAVAAA